MTAEPEADRSVIAHTILDILAETAADYAAYADQGTDLRDAPLHLLCVDIARGLAKSFGNLRFRLESPADAPAQPPRRDADLRDTSQQDPAAFDIVLLDDGSGSVRHVIEVEHGTRIIDDVHRMMRTIAPVHGRAGSRHGFVVAILRRSQAQAIRIAEKLEAEIEDPSTRESAGLPANLPLTVMHRLRRIGDSRSCGKDGTSIYAVVFALSLAAGAAGTAD